MTKVDPPKLRYNEDLALWEFLISVQEEIEIEAQVLYGDDLPERVRFSMIYALRQIDELKVAGRYQAERARLAAKMPPPPPLPDLSGEGPRAIQNYIWLRQSPDPEQRARIENLRTKERLPEKSPSDVMHILRVLEPAKRAKGRPTLKPPWRNEVGPLDEMRMLVAEGYSIPAAARQVAAVEGTAQAESRAKRLERLYRKRIALRDLK